MVAIVLGLNKCGLWGLNSAIIKKKSLIENRYAHLNNLAQSIVDRINPEIKKHIIHTFEDEHNQIEECLFPNKPKRMKAIESLYLFMESISEKIEKGNPEDSFVIESKNLLDKYKELFNECEKQKLKQYIFPSYIQYLQLIS